MEQFLLASHGSLARAMKETAAFLLGANENVHCLCAYVDEASMNLEKMVGEWVTGRKPEEHWTVITDIFGGSVNNEFMKYTGDRRFNLVAGMSLPLVIALLNHPDAVDPDTIRAVLAQVRSSIVYCNDMVENQDLEDEDF
ncbi:hypothetical protein MCJ35_28660 [Enterocloster sp. OA13]|uniref:PTS sugar transporter subunit IIA n=1 Tax=Enterocloster sp. OA13 TaxID=2914161 RepID=UPI00047288E1|nr:hypothetical protein [Enterocloster sp. OA13]